jgi:hypothetical protein
LSNWVWAKLEPLGEGLVSILAAPAVAFSTFSFSFFNRSLLVGFIIMGVSAWASGNFLMEFYFPRSPWLDAITAFADPFSIQLLWTLGICFVSFLVARATYRSSSSHSLRVPKIIATTIMPAGILLSSFVVGDALFKLALMYDRPQYPLPDTGLTAIFCDLLSRPEGGDSAPSGFVLRQLALFVTVWLMLKQPYFDGKPKRLLRWLIHSINLGTLVLVAFSRVYRRAHRLFDVSLSIGVGLVIVWTLLVAAYRASSRRYQHVFFTVAASNLALAGFLFYYAHAPGLLMRNAGYTLVVLAIYYVLIEAFVKKPAQRTDA